MTIIDYILAVAVAMLWGGNFVAAKIAMMYFPPIFTVAVRFVLVAILLIPFMKPPKGQWKQVAAISFTLGTLHFILVFMGIHMGMSVSTSVVTVQMGVPFSCIMGAILLDDKLGAWRTAGLGIAFMGIVMLAGAPEISANLTAFFMVLTGAFFWSVSNIQIKKLEKMPILRLLAWTSLLSVPQLLLASWILEDGQWELLMRVDVQTSLAILYSVVCSTLMAYSFWYYLLGKHDVSQVVPFNLLVPVFGMMGGVLVLGEVLTPYIIAGSLVTMLGVAIIVFRKPRLARFDRQ